jgi:hypothetical protein
MLLALTAPAHARTVSGIVQAVDPAAGIVYFSDGRIVHLDPSAQVIVNGQNVSLADLRAGNQVDLDQVSGADQPTATTGRQHGAVQQGRDSQTQQPVALSAHPPVDAIGTVASIDQQAGTITLRDGRVLKITPQTTFWQQAQPQQLRQDKDVFIDDAKPVAFRQPGKAEMRDDGSMRMGTVASVDGQHNVIVLTDGTRVHMNRAAVIRFNGQPIAITELTPGSEIVIRVHPAQTEAQPSASPATTGEMRHSGTRASNQMGHVLRPGDGRVAEFQSDEVMVVRKHQSP